MSSEMQKDLVLNPNEYAYLLDRTKGIVNCYVGPTKTSLSNTDAPVVFDPATKRFVECRLEDAIHLFVTAPENWYIVLKNPDPNGKHPSPRAINELPNLEIGRKVNITGPTSFALYPGQMAKVVKGHTLRSNQYLLARVYDEKSARENWGNSIIKAKEVINDDQDPSTLKEQTNQPEDVAAEAKNPSISSISADDLTIGKLLVIKGTEVSFYIPPIGIEVIPVGGAGDKYVRDAVTLERLEYCILKDEDGNKRYVHGPAVVFPEPTEVFMGSNDGYKFRAIELSKISGIYVKVIAEYDDNQGHHNVGEEMFITGKEQMIYYPRPEHAIITYDDRILHHAVAIPAGEGRYVMNRMTGEISTVKGPSMFLPDPRTQVIVKRKLTRSQAALWYPGNAEVLQYNESLGDVRTDLEKYSFSASAPTSRAKSMLTPDDLTSSSLFNRGTSFTPPRTITIDNKFDGVVSIDVWTGYAINVISKDGKRKVVAGPCTYLMDYDETLEILEMSTGKPKNTDKLIRTTFLRVDNNKIGDIIDVETKDFVNVSIKVSYCVNFLSDYQNKWFSVENYVKYLCDRVRSLLKREAKKYTIEEFYLHCSEIVRRVTLDRPDPNADQENAAETASKYDGRFFPENGMLIHDVEVLKVNVDPEVADMLEDHQREMIKKTIELSDADQRTAMAKRIAEANKTILDLEHATAMYQIQIRADSQKKNADLDAQIQATAAEMAKAKLQATQDQQKLLDSINAAEIAREDKERASELKYQQDLANLEKARRDAYAASTKQILEAVSPQLVAAIENLSNQTLMRDIAQQMSPLAIVNGESISDTVNKLMKGTALEGILEAFTNLSTKPEERLEDPSEN